MSVGVGVYFRLKSVFTSQPDPGRGYPRPDSVEGPAGPFIKKEF